MHDRLIIYGMPPSQPARVLFWACLLKELPFEVCRSRSDLFYTDGTNPRGQVPAIKDGEFCLSEMAAIICYLAEKHGWTDLYPEELHLRAKIHEFLHQYHMLLRLATLKLMGAFVVKPLGKPDIFDNPYGMGIRDLISVSFGAQDPLKEGGDTVRAITDFFEKHYFGEASPYVFNTASPTLADLVCYSELGQFQFAKLFDFSAFPKTMRWLEAMAGVPHHDAIHAYNVELGDIVSTPNNPDRFMSAIDVGFDALQETGMVKVTVID